MSETPPLTDSRPLPGSRDRTPELTTKREKRHREDDEDDRDRHAGSRSHHRSRHDGDDDGHGHRRRHERDDETEEEREERRRRRREREQRERADGNDNGNGDHKDRDREREAGRDREHRDRREERHRDRDREREKDRDRGDRHERERRDSHASRDRSRESHRSSLRDQDRDRDREALREERERERERRDREMMEERREAARRYDDRDRDRDSYGYRDNRRRSPPRYRDSPRRGGPPPEEVDPVDKLLNEVDSEKRSIFVSQIAAALTSSDLALFFEDKLGRGAVRDARVVTDKNTRRSKGIGYVELASVEVMNKALQLSGTIVMGIPIIIQFSEAEKNREGVDIHSLIQKASDSRPPPRERRDRDRDYRDRDRDYRDRDRDRRDQREPQMRFPPLSTGLALPLGLDPDAHAGASIPYHRLFVRELAYTLSAQDVREVFEPFGEIEFVDLHLDFHGQSKGTGYVQFKDLSSAQMALDAMHNFELAGQKIRVQPIQTRSDAGPERIDDGTSGHMPKLDHKTRQQLMYKLAREEMPTARTGGSTPGGGAQAGSQARSTPPVKTEPVRPTTFVLVGNMFNPDEETERNWDLDLAEDVKDEVERQYGRVGRIKVDKMSAGDVYIEFAVLDASEAAVKGLNGRFFGGKQLKAGFISEGLFKAHM